MSDESLLFVIWNDADQSWYRKPTGKETAWTRVPDCATRFRYGDAIQLKMSFPKLVRIRLKIRHASSMPGYAARGERVPDDAA